MNGSSNKRNRSTSYGIKFIEKLYIWPDMNELTVAKNCKNVVRDGLFHNEFLKEVKY